MYFVERLDRRYLMNWGLRMKDYLKRMLLLIAIGFFMVYWMTGASSSGFFTDLADLITNIIITIIIIILALVIGRYKNKYSWKKVMGFFVLPMLVVTLMVYPIINGNNISRWYNRYKLNQVQKQFSVDLLERTSLIDSESYSFTQYFLTTDNKYIAFREGDKIVVKSRDNKITDTFYLTEDALIFMNQRKHYKPKNSLSFQSFRTYRGDYIKIGDKFLEISEEGKFVPME